MSTLSLFSQKVSTKPGELQLQSYVSGILRLTLLASEIVEAVLDGRQPAEMQLRDLMEGVTIDWSQQHRFRTSLPARYTSAS
jgi:hypothetical protein